MPASLELASLLLLLALPLPARAQGAFRLLSLGDSIAAGSSSEARPPSWPAGNDAASGGWRSALYFGLVDSGVPADALQFVGSQSSGPDEVPAAQRMHEGHPGWTCAQLTAINGTWAPLAPDAILLMCGTNDSNHGNSAATFAADMTALLAVMAARLPLARVFVATIIADGNSLIAAYNAALRVVVAGFPHATLVEMANETGMCNFKVGNDCNPNDRTHPTAGGYPFLASSWWRAVVPVFFPIGSRRRSAPAPNLPPPPAVVAAKPRDETPHSGSGPAGTPLRLLPIGDSITAGCGSLARPPTWDSGCDNGAPAAGSGSYRAPLYHALLGSGVDAGAFLFVGSQSSGPDSVPQAQWVHEGHAGWTVSQLTGISYLWGPLKPDVVLIHAGTNDAGGAHSVATFVSDMTALINATLTQASPRRVLVATIISSAASPQLAATIAAYNAALPAVVALFAPASGVVLVDMARGTAGLCRPGGTDCCEGDKTHPTAAGYMLMAAVWWRFLADLFPISSERGRAATAPANNTAAILRPCNVSVVDGRVAAVQRFAFNSSSGALALQDGSGRCLAVAGCSGSDGAAAVYVPCSPGGDACAAAAQGWSFPSGGPQLLSAAGSNKCLEIHGGTNADQLDAWDCQTNAIRNMEWRFNATSGALISECAASCCGGLCVTPADWAQ